MSLAPTQLTAAQADIDAVNAVAREYIDSYVAGDAERHERVYHAECTKRRFVTDPDSGVTELVVLTPRVMADYAGALGPVGESCDSEVVIDDISEDLASVRIYSCRWVDFAHIVKARGEWRLLHVTWHGRPQA